VNATVEKGLLDGHQQVVGQHAEEDVRLHPLGIEAIGQAVVLDVDRDAVVPVV
jgi:hypothetical protein